MRPRFCRDLLVWCTGILGDPTNGKPLVTLRDAATIPSRTRRAGSFRTIASVLDVLR